MEQYALIFIGHPFEYEVQATAKLFIPGVRFTLLHKEDETISNFILTKQENDQQQVHICLHGKEERRTQPISGNRSDQEYALCRMLFDMLREMTGYTPPWGLLTGIRPVRKVIQELQSGLSIEDVSEKLGNTYCISPEKLKLACDTAQVQLPILPHSPREIGLYISIPFCPTRCSYCSFVSHSMDTARQLIPAYVEKLCQEISVWGNLIDRFNLHVHSVYIGGGTPTSLTADQLRQVMNTVADCTDLSHTREYTVEAGRADTITEDKLLAIREMGATRISVNPQTLQDDVLKAVGRCHTAAQTVEAFHMARKLGFNNINMDLIAGLPTDTLTGFQDTLERIMELDPDSVTVHTLTLKRSADLYGSDQSVQTKLVEKMTEFSAKQLPQKGYRPYYLYRQKNTLGNLENVGYAKPGKENLYNILIMDETQTIFGAGCGASTKLVEPDGGITRVMNYKFPFEYINNFDTMMEKKRTVAEALEQITERMEPDAAKK